MRGFKFRFRNSLAVVWANSLKPVVPVTTEIYLRNLILTTEVAQLLESTVLLFL